MNAETVERLEVLRRIGERGLALAQAGSFHSHRSDGYVAASAEHLDLWQHLLDELSRVSREPSP